MEKDIKEMCLCKAEFVWQQGLIVPSHKYQYQVLNYKQMLQTEKDTLRIQIRPLSTKLLLQKAM